MARKWWLALLALVLVSPAVAQLMKVQPIPQVSRPVVVQPVQPVQEDSNVAQKVMTIEEAQAQIAKLRQEKRDLDSKLTEALATIDQWTQKGGSLVHAYCESDEISRNSAGATENCADSGYRCASVEGTCRRSCNVTTDCAGYHVCDTARHVCVRT